MPAHFSGVCDALLIFACAPRESGCVPAVSLPAVGTDCVPGPPAGLLRPSSCWVSSSDSEDSEDESRSLSAPWKEETMGREPVGRLSLGVGTRGATVTGDVGSTVLCALVHPILPARAQGAFVAVPHHCLTSLHHGGPTAVPWSPGRPPEKAAQSRDLMGPPQRDSGWVSSPTAQPGGE